MEKSILKYLAEFSELALNYGSTVNLNALFGDADRGKLNIAEDFSWLEDFSYVMERIQGILTHGHIHVKYVKDLRRAETASRVDSDCFHMTMREPRLWRKAGDSVAPEFVYHNSYEDEHAIYENRFVKQLIDEMTRYLADTLNELALSFGSLRTYFNSELPVTEALRLAHNAKKNSDDDQVLANSDDPVVKRAEAVEYLFNKATRFKYSRLYIECAKLPPITGNVQATNILLHDPNYRTAYIFYKKLRHMRLQDADMNNALFNNVLLRLIYALKKSGYSLSTTAPLYSQNGRLMCKDFIMEKGEFALRIDTYESNELTLTSFMRNRERPDKAYDLSCVAIKVADFAPDTAEKDINSYREAKIKKGFNDAFIFVLSRLPTKTDGIINLANRSGEFYSRAAQDFIQSLTLLLGGSHKIFSKRCPVCGSRYVEQSDNSFICSQCGGQWSLVIGDNNEKVWVKRLRH